MPTAILLLALSSSALAAADEWEQRWNMKRSRSADRVHFSIERWRPGSRWMNSTDVPVSRFRNFSTDMLDRSGEARFEFVHDAGRVVCTGTFAGGSGSGNWTFAPDPTFASELRRLGYGQLDDEQLLSLFLHDVSLEFARGVRDAGLQASLKELIDMRIHGVRLEFIRDLKENGYNLPVRDIIEIRIHGVTSELIRDLKAAGYDLTGKEIAQLRMHGVSPQYVRDLRAYGLRPPASDLVQLKIHGVTPDYLRGLRDAGYSGLSVREIISLRNHGVSPDFVREASNLGYRFTAKELTDLRIHGVDGAYLRKLRDAGMKNLSASQIAKLRMHGVY
ncbi:MAG TPA: hypothetical protein VFL57_02930 [Bryobacteraceae bacterium]|nr:hypothetical protein [Bryobacteraceae bacterium]